MNVWEVGEKFSRSQRGIDVLKAFGAIEGDAVVKKLV